MDEKHIPKNNNIAKRNRIVYNSGTQVFKGSPMLPPILK